MRCVDIWVGRGKTYSSSSSLSSLGRATSSSSSFFLFLVDIVSYLCCSIVLLVVDAMRDDGWTDAMECGVAEEKVGSWKGAELRRQSRGGRRANNRGAGRSDLP